MRYIILGQHSGLRVPELVLGTRMFGTKWGHGADLDESRRMFDGYVESGGNFLDTSDCYQIGDPNPCSASSSRQTGTIS